MKLLVYDNIPDGEANTESTILVSWSCWGREGEFISIPDLVEHNQEKLRQEYLEFVKKFSSEDNINSLRSFSQPKGYSHFFHSSVFTRALGYQLEIYDVLKFFSLEQLLNEKVPSEIVYMGCDPKLFQVLKEISKNKKIPLRSLNYYPPPFFKNIIDSLKSHFDGLREVISQLKLHSHPFYNKYDPGSTNVKEITIFLYFPNLDEKLLEKGKFRSNYLNSLHHNIDSLDYKVNWFFIIAGKSKYSTKELISIRNKLQENCKKDQFFFLHDFFSFMDILLLFLEWLYNSFTLIRKKNFVKFFKTKDGHNLFPLMAKGWRESLNGKRSVSLLMIKRNINSALKRLGHQKFLLFVSEGHNWEYVLADSWRKYQKTKIVAFRHVLCRPMEFMSLYTDKHFKAQLNGVLPDIFTVSGDMDQNLLTQFGIDEKSIRKVDAVRYSYLNSSYLSLPSKEKSDTLLLVGDLRRGHTEFMFNTLLDYLEKEGSNQLKKILIKYHPMGAWSFDISPFERYGVKVKEEQSSVSKLWEEVDFVLCGNSTTVALEALYMGKKIAIALEENKVNYSPLSDYKKFFIRNGEDLHRLLESGYTIDLGKDFFHFTENNQLWDKLFQELRAN